MPLGRPVLPGGMSVVRPPSHRAVNSCLAIVWSHWDVDGNEWHEAIFSSPHGVVVEQGSLRSFLDAEPPILPLAMLHGLKESHIRGKQI